MKLRETFRLEFGYQARRWSTWLYFAAVGFFAIAAILGNYVDDAKRAGYLVNAPWVIASVAVFDLLWLLATAALSGDLATRDVRTRMDPLLHSAPVSKTAYLGGRFLAAFVLNALVVFAVPLGTMVAMHSPDVDAGILGPFRTAAYLDAWFFFLLPNVFVATAIAFSLAVLSRRGVASYLGGLLLLVAAMGATLLADGFGWWNLAKLVDPLGMAVIGDLTRTWTPLERNTRLIGLHGWLLWNRVLWLGIALAVLTFTHHRFRFGYVPAGTWWDRIIRRRDRHIPTAQDAPRARNAPVTSPPVRRATGLAARTRQVLKVAWTSSRPVALHPAILSLSVLALLAGAFLSEGMRFMTVPVTVRTADVLRILTTPAPGPGPWLLIPLFITFWAGELVWREREAGLNELSDAAPVPEWVLFLGKFLGLGLLAVAMMALLMATGVVAQWRAGDHDMQLGLYLQVLFGIQLANYLLLALFALAVHVVVNQKHFGHLLVLLTLVGMLAAYGHGVGHHLLVPGSAPRWSYTEMRGFGPSLGPWLWFKGYWTAWALLAALIAGLLWVRSSEPGFAVRVRMARRRFTRPAAGVVAVALGLVLGLGGFSFYNTNVLNAYETPADGMDRRVGYERRYARFEHVPQPTLTAVALRVDIHPHQRSADIRGTYTLVNREAAALDSIHLSTVPEVETGRVILDRASTEVLDDEAFGYRIYVLQEPLQPGDSLSLSFEVHVAPHGFKNDGVDASIAPKATYFTNQQWLPAIGYQRSRELSGDAVRAGYGLAPRVAIPSLDDIDARNDVRGAAPIALDAVVSTDEDQTAVAPGVLRRTWVEAGRRYFDYATDAPIGNAYAIFSAGYAVREARWNDVAIQVIHDRAHAANVDRIVQAVQAALSYCTAHFGPYPYRYIRFVERPGEGHGMHTEAATSAYDEGFSFLNPLDASGGFDLVRSVVAHEVAHRWWGAQLPYAPVEGAPLITESLAQYSAMRVVEESEGDEQLQRLLRFMRATVQPPPTRIAAPLLRAGADQYLWYRRGPYAMYALSTYVGTDRIDTALRRLLVTHRSAAAPLATSLDLYRELETVTPDSLRYLLHDLFETNTWWELETTGAAARQIDAGTWQVTLDVRARKVLADSAGRETEVPLDEWIPVGVFAPGDEDNELANPLDVRMHHIHSGSQSITITVQGQPARAGIDPYHLLDWDPGDNTANVDAGTEGA